jgi:equilibrative nucleoside transporter 1/2/3
MIISILLLITLLTMSTIVPVSPNMFFMCVLTLAVLAGATAAYLQCSVSAVASLFGPTALQAFVSGQAAVAVAVSVIQLISAAVSLAGNTGASLVPGIVHRPPEESSAFAFFAFSTCFLGVSFLAHSLLIGTPAYQHLVLPRERKALARLDPAGERQALLASPQELLGIQLVKAEREEPLVRIQRLARANIVYEIAVAYVFLITVVSSMCS